MFLEPSISLSKIVFVSLLVGLGGFVDASAGGGGLITLPAYAVTGLPMHIIYAANKFSSACGNTSSSLMFLRKGALDWQVAAIAAGFSFLGSFLGTQLVLLLSDEILKILVLVMIPVAALIIFTQQKQVEENQTSNVSLVKKLVLSGLIGLLIGGYDGLIGPGAGTFAILAFTSILHIDLRRASGNAKVLNLASNYASLITYIIAGNIPYVLAVPCGICNICGALLGSHIALSKGSKFIRPMMLLVMTLLLIKMVIDLLLF